MPSISRETVESLTDILKEAGKTLPAPAFVVGSADGILYEGREGRVDILDERSEKPNKDTIYAFYSTTKLITSVSTQRYAVRALMVACHHDTGRCRQAHPRHGRYGSSS
jgi:hypothetical protein